MENDQKQKQPNIAPAANQHPQSDQFNYVDGASPQNPGSPVPSFESPDTAKQKIYSQNSTMFAAVLAGPFAVLYMLTISLRRVGHKTAATAVGAGGFVVVVVLLALTFLFETAAGVGVLGPTVLGAGLGLIAYVHKKYILNLPEGTVVYYKPFASFITGLVLFLLTITPLAGLVYYTANNSNLSVGDVADITLRDFDYDKFATLEEQFINNEARAGELLNSASTEEELTSASVESKELFESNLGISLQLQQIDNLPTALKDYSTTLESYSRARINTEELRQSLLSDLEPEATLEAFNAAIAEEERLLSELEQYSN